jgi:plasmid stabilization system protein ParE
MRLRYTRPALADLDSILEYISSNSLPGAARVHARIETVIGLLLTHPRIGVRTDDPSIRRVGAHPYPYLIFYEVSGDEIVIHAVRHAARDPSGMPGVG